MPEYLLDRAVSGDETALQEMLLERADRLRARISRRLPSSIRSVTAVEDILQETFIEACRKISSFVPAGQLAFDGWLLTIADHRLSDAVKAHRAAKRGGGRQPRPIEGDRSSDRLVEVIAAARRSPSQSVARHEALDAVRSGFYSLKPQYREALSLRFLQGLALEDAAEVLGTTAESVRKLCRRGLDALKQELGNRSRFLSR